LVIGRYTRQGLWSLFLMCALPLHAWTMVLAFRDLSWVTERTNAWDAVGVLSYGLVFALVDSVVVFGVMVVLGFLVSGRWEAERRIGLLSVLVLVLSLWAMVEQLYFLLDLAVPGVILDALIHTGHPLRAIWVGLPAVVGATFVVPALLVLRTKGGLRFVGGLIERLSLLAMLYLVFDVVGAVIVLVRNI